MRSIFVAVAVAVVALAAVAAADPSDIHRPIEMDGAFEHSFMDDISITIIDLIGKFGDFLRDIGVVGVLDKVEDFIRATLKEQLPGSVAWIDWAMTYRHPYVDHLDLPLMNPLHVIVIAIGYVVSVQLGRVMMRGREKFTLRGYSLFHNAFLVLLSAFMCAEVLRQAYLNSYVLFANYSRYKESELGMTRIIWIFYFSKIPEFIDTFIMVLKKNDRQISFLHQYHHVTIFSIWWCVTYFYPCGEAYFSAAQNSFVHVIMYSYYFFSTLGYRFAWKAVITYAQMTQFLLNMVQAAYDIWIVKVNPVWLMELLFYYMISLLVLFGNYLRVQKGRGKGKGSKAAKAAAKKAKSKSKSKKEL